MNILEEALSIVHGPRQHDYGHPLDNHSTTAEMWSAYLSRKLRTKIELTPEDVCFLNVLQKISRQANRPTRDNIVDVAGYAANVEMIQTARKLRAATTGSGLQAPEPAVHDGVHGVTVDLSGGALPGASKQ